jgi:MFS family permease
MMLLGNFGVVFGIFMLSLSKNYWQIFLSQGVCMGIGAGLLYVPSVALLGLSFSTKRSVAQGIVTSGIAVGEFISRSSRSRFHTNMHRGGIAYILAFDRLTTSKGFGWAVRTLGFMSLGICLLALPALLYGTEKLREPRTARKLYDSAALKDRKFLVYTSCSFITFLGYITPYFYLASFGQDVLGMTKDQANNILLGAISASFFGRLGVGMVAHRYGSILTWLICATISGVIAISWVAVDSKAGLICFAVFWGFCSGGLVTLPAAVFPGLCPNRNILGTRLGMSLGISSFASLIGSPIAGALLHHGKPNDGNQVRFLYLGPQLWSGGCLLAGAAMISILYRMTHPKQKPDSARVESP